MILQTFGREQRKEQSKPIENPLIHLNPLSRVFTDRASPYQISANKSSVHRPSASAFPVAKRARSDRWGRTSFTTCNSALRAIPQTLFWFSLLYDLSCIWIEATYNHSNRHSKNPTGIRAQSLKRITLLSIGLLPLVLPSQYFGQRSSIASHEKAGDERNGQEDQKPEGPVFKL